jgi:hypothetical protein
MNIPIKTRNEVPAPPSGFVFPFIDAENNKFTVKLNNEKFITFNSGSDLPADFNPLDWTDCTAWEVYPTSEVLEANTYTQNDFTNKAAIPANNIEEFKVSIITTVENSDVVIDWGDGNKSVIAKNEYINVGSANARGERDVTVKHEYTVSDTKYIIRVFGRGYCKIVHYSNNNLMCRVFEADLPIASHFKNLWQFAHGAKRLLSVTVGQMHPIVFATNLGGLFQNCTNLQKATGFERMYNLWGVGSMFNGCINLKTTDFKFSPDVYQADNAFLNCLVLERDINDFFQSLNGSVLAFKNSYVDLAGAFANCQFLYGTISDAVKNILWNNSKAKINTSSSATPTTLTFTNVGLHQNNSVNESYNLLNQIPVSWGGTNTDIVPAKLIEEQVDIINSNINEINSNINGINSNINKLNLDNLIDYTAWEVYPTDKDLAPGEYSKTFIVEGQEVTFTNPTKVDAGMTEQFAIYTNSPAEESDVIVDWGDGSISSIKNGDYFSVKTDDNQEYIFEVAHTYEVPNQTYTVKVYGRKYWKIGHIASSGNLMSRCFTDDLPIASHLMSLGNFACRAFKLLYVNIPAYHRVLTIPTWVNCFLECKNLLKATGFKRIYPLYSLGHLFHGCWNLTDTDFRIPTTATDISYIFCNCQSLVKDVSSLFDNQANTLLGFANSTVSINYSFYGTRRITGTIPADILWNNQKTKFLGSGECFTNSALSSQAPISWGGTASDTIIETPTNNKVNELTSKVSELETSITDIEKILGTLSEQLNEALTEVGE